MKTDRSTPVGGRRSKAGSDATAGNSVKTSSMGPNFKSKVTAVANQAKRFKKTRTRRA